LRIRGISWLALVMILILTLGLIAGCGGGQQQAPEGEKEATEEPAKEPAKDDKYPSRTIEVINQFGPGGGTDIFVRGIAVGASKALKQSVIPISVTGGGGVAATERFLKEPADGYTLRATGPEQVINHLMGREDLTKMVPIIRCQMDQSTFSVKADSQFKTIQDVVDYAKANLSAISFHYSSKENLYKYIKAFGFGETTGIDLNGEQAGIIPTGVEKIKDVNLATISYGQGIAVTPMQMVNAMSTISNGGNLMEPRIVKELIDDEGEVVISYEPKLKRKVLSESTSKVMLEMLESVVTDGTGSKAYIPGFRVGGKTGTAQKYVPGKYVASFAAVAPVDDPQIAILVIIDEPSTGQHYGGTIAAPVARDVLEETLNYLEIEPIFTEEEKEKTTEKVIVPDSRNKKIGEAGKLLTDNGLKYTTEYLELTSESIVVDQFPLPGTEVLKGSIIDLYIDIGAGRKIITPYLLDKNKEEIMIIFEEMGLNYEIKGNGKVKSQNPIPGEEINIETKIEVELGET